MGLRRALGTGIAAGFVALALTLGQVPGAAAQGVATLTADRLRIDGAGRLEATGAVEVWQGSTRLTASRVIYDRRRNSIQIDGPLVLSQGPDRVLVADQALLSRDLREGLIQSARLVLDQQLQVAAREMRRGGGLNQMDAVIASTCRVCAEDPTPLWEIRAARVTHNEDTRRLLFEDAQFRFRGVPVFWLPRLRVNEPGVPRAAGFLVPEFNSNDALGVQVALPFFIPIGDDRDVTLTPGLGSNGMARMGLRYRQAWAGAGLQFDGQIARDNTLPGQIRGYGELRAMAALPADFTLTARLTGVSDARFLEDYSISPEARLTNHLTIERVRRDEWVRLRALAFQSLRAGDVNAELPNLAAQGVWERRYGLDHTALGGAAMLRFSGQGFRRESTTDGDAGRDVARIGLMARWQRDMVMGNGVLLRLAGQGSLDHVRVGDDSAFAQPVTRAAAQGVVELRWPLARVDSHGARHLLEPVVQLVGGARHAPALPNDTHRMPELDAGNLLALDRATASDAPDDGSRLTLALRWARFDGAGWSVDTTVGRVWRSDMLAGFGAGHVQPLGAMRSDWLLGGRLDTAQGHSAALTLLVDDAGVVSRGETRLNLAHGASGVSASWLYVPANTAESRPLPLDQIGLDVTHRFGSGWAARIGGDYDLASASAATARAGLEFRNDCLLVDAVFLRNFATPLTPTPSTGFSLRVQLLGLGGGGPSPGRACRT